jgi:hypothetical protein
VIEVAETALDFFMGEKARLYAMNGIPEYWWSICRAVSSTSCGLPDRTAMPSIAGSSWASVSKRRR